MRYALTFTLGGFERTDTIIVEVSGDPAKHIFGDEAKDIEEALEKGTAVELAQSALTDYFYEELPIYLAENA